MQFVETPLKDVYLIEPKVFGDDRGFFMETFRDSDFAALGITVQFVQDNHSRSSQGILRGLHSQNPNAQGKLVRVVAGEVYDVAVDLRKNSVTYGQWLGEYLSADNKKMLWVPAGFAHGFYVTSEYAEFVYKCTNYYAPEHEQSIRWDDPQLNIQWPIPPGETPKLSAKDLAGIEFDSVTPVSL